MAGNITVAGPAGGMYPDIGWEGDLTSVVFLPRSTKYLPGTPRKCQGGQKQGKSGERRMAQCNGGSWMGCQARKGREVETKEI